jgi:hypothetical protein
MIAQEEGRSSSPVAPKRKILFVLKPHSYLRFDAKSIPTARK